MFKGRWVNLAGLAIMCSCVSADVTADYYSLVQGETLIADGIDGRPEGVLANDGSVRDFSPQELVGEGTLKIAPDGTFSYTPPAQFIGQVSFSYAAATKIENTVLVEENATWQYLAPTEDPATADGDFHSTWQATDFDDSAWADGFGLMGFGSISGHAFDTAVEGRPWVVYFRHDFEAAAGTYDLRIQLVRDDGAILYLNGEEIVRSHEGAGGFETAPDAYLIEAPPSGVPEGTTHEAEALAQPLHAGLNTLAVSLHNESHSSADLGLKVVSIEGTRIFDPVNVAVTIDVTDLYVPPQLASDRYLIYEGEILDTTLNYSLYKNDGILSREGLGYDPIIELVISGDAAPQVTANKATGDFVFTPLAGFSGVTSFDYQVRDKDGLSDPVTVKITAVPPVPDNPPQAVPDAYTMVQGEILSTNRTQGVLLNDLYSDAADLDLETTNGSLDFHSDGSFDYTPHPNYIGIDQFGYSAQNYIRAELMDETSPWRWLHPLDGIDPAIAMPSFNAEWPMPNFDDWEWLTGSGLFGYGLISDDGLHGVPIPNSNYFDVPIDTFIGMPGRGNRRTAYFRSRFGSAPGTFTLELELMRDDAAIIYINGIEVARSSEVGAQAIQTEPDTYDLMVEPVQSSWVFGSAEGMIHQLRFENIELLASENHLAISLHNTTGTSGDASSSDLGLMVTSLSIVPYRSAVLAAIEVVDGMLVPQVVGDDFVMEVGETKLFQGLYDNDQLLDQGGTPFDPILSATFSTPAVGTIDTFDQQKGEFAFTAGNAPAKVELNYSVTDKDGSSEPAPVTIEIRDSFEAWTLRNFGEEADPAGTDHAADPDGDGIFNGIEYVLGLDPNHFNKIGEELLQVVTRQDGSVALKLEVGELRPGDATLSIQCSPDMKRWSSFSSRYQTSLLDWSLYQAASSSDTSISSETDSGRVTYVFSNLPEQELYRFYRLRVSYGF